MVIKFSDKNVGRTLKIRGKEHEVEKVLANKQVFRVKQGEGDPVHDFSLDDIEEVEGLVIDIE